MAALDEGVSSESDLIRAYREWLPNLTTRMDLTLKRRAKLSPPDPRRANLWLTLNEDRLSATVVRALNRLNGYVLRPPRRLRHRPRLNALAWSERGAVSNRWHIHALIERPTFWSPQSFAAAASTAWRAQPLGHREMRIEEIRDAMRSLRYNTKADRTLGNLIYVHVEQDETAWWRRDWLTDWTTGDGRDLGTPRKSHAGGQTDQSPPRSLKTTSWTTRVSSGFSASTSSLGLP